MPHTNEGTPPHAHPTRSAGYLTIARLHTGTPLLADAHAVHRAVCAATHTSHGRVLWAHPTRRVLLIHSPTPPDMTRIPDVASHTIVAPRLPHAGARVRWALIANPVKATGPRDPETGRFLSRTRRHPLPEPEWETWVRRKLAPALADLDEISSEALPSWKARPPGRPPITHLRVCYTGTATVVGEDALARLVAEGVGPGKAFGCGLLLVEQA